MIGEHGLGRAGRRGIDTEGHAVVVDHPGLDPVALAGLASKRLYPLRSSFRPTYNMAVNLVAQVGRERAREVLETSFAQFQADRGVVGLATGSAAFPGAALLSTRGALAGPTGLVRYAGPAHAVVVTLHPTVIGSPRVADTGRVQAWVCGSGLGQDKRAGDELRAVLASPVPAVLDADAITLLVDGTLANHLRARNAPTVLTPHDGEFTRLAGEAPGEDRVAAALKPAHSAGLRVPERSPSWSPPVIWGASSTPSRTHSAPIPLGP